MAKATISINDSDGERLSVHIEFDPALPPGEKTAEWLEKLSAAHLAGILAMQQIMDHCEGTSEISVTREGDNQTRQ